MAQRYTNAVHSGHVEHGQSNQASRQSATSSPRAADSGALNARLTQWLPVYCAQLPGVTRAFLFVAAEPAPGVRQLGSWPQPAQCPAQLAELAGIALTGRPRVTRARENDGWVDRLVIPIKQGEDVLGSLACEAHNLSSAQREALLAKLGAGVSDSTAPRKPDEPNHQLEIVVQLLASCLDAPRAQAARMAFVTETATRLGCDRASIGRLEKDRVRLQALSHSARVEQRSNLVRAIEAAMNESIEQGATIVYPRPEAADTPDRDHAALARFLGNAHLVTVPLVHDATIVGAITVERHGHTPFDPITVALCESLGAVAGPILELRHRDERSLAAHMRDAARATLRALVGPRHIGKKLATATALALVAWMSFATGTHRITAPASLEGSVQRAIVAPLDGFVASAAARPGDRVAASAVLARLDDRDLVLDVSRWNSELSQLRKQHRSAMATHDRARTSILKTQIARAEAQLELLQSQLARTELRAPFAGIVVAGDLSQLLGSPVQRGDVLFEIAPLDDYRVALQIDERDIGAIETGSRGQLALEGLPQQRLAIVVQSITPVATARDGRNFFRVEAQLEVPTEALRPGMAGVAKIEAGERKHIWIWTHRIVDWLRLAIWRWQP